MEEDWNDGSRAQVSTKWNDYYGTIDSNLQFKSSMSTVLPTADSSRWTLFIEVPMTIRKPPQVEDRDSGKLKHHSSSELLTFRS